MPDAALAARTKSAAQPTGQQRSPLRANTRTDGQRAVGMRAEERALLQLVGMAVQHVHERTKVVKGHAFLPHSK